MSVITGIGVWWAVAGGWAIDVWLDRETRDHHDVEVVVRREDQAVVHAGLAPAWELRCLDPPGSAWRRWDGPPMRPPAFQLQVRSSAFEFDLFTENVVEANWHYRRDARVSLPVAAVTTTSRAGIPVVRPEVQLLYMARSTEPKNQQDFAAARRSLTAGATAWLAGALELAHPGHRWIQELR